MFHFPFYSSSFSRGEGKGVVRQYIDIRISSDRSLNSNQVCLLINQSIHSNTMIVPIVGLAATPLRKSLLWH